ncbi:MAG TPA: OmpH family outer membrane protein [bacterium]|nr:OmpH family outer membrane protein [bacterium]
MFKYNNFTNELEEEMGSKKIIKMVMALFIILIIAAPGFSQKLKIAYVHSQKILSDFKEAIDVQRKIDEIDRQFQAEGREMQERLRLLQDQYESQALLLSDAKKKEKEQEIQNLILKLQQFQQEKYNPQTGEIYKIQADLLQPVLDKINGIIKKIGEEENYDLILDTAAGNILHVSDQITDLTERILEELDKASVKK